MNITILFGERRRVYVEITASDGTTFAIRNPVYALKYGGTVEAEGVCELDEHIVSAVIEPENKGNYTLEFTMEIADELIKKRAQVTVQ